MMRKQQILETIIIVLLNITLTSPLLAQSDNNYRFKNITGLSDNNVTCIFEDHLGYIWIGTRNGINRFNGSHFDVFEPIKNDSTSIRHPYINYMTESSNGDVWIAHGGGLSRFNRSTHDFYNLKHIEENPSSIAEGMANHVFCDKDDNIWVANMGVDLLDSENNKVQKRYLNGENIEFIFQDSKGRIWITGDKIFLMDLDKRIQQILPEENDLNIKSVTEDSQGNIWLGSWEKGLYKLTDLGNNQFSSKLYTPEAGQNSLHLVRILEIINDGEGNIWIGIENGGLDVFNIISEQFTHFKPDPKNPKSIHSNSIWALYKDSNQRIWIGSFDKGIDLMDPYQKPFIKVNDNEGNMDHSAVNTFAEDSKNNLWVGADGYGLDYYNVNTGTFQHYEHEPNNPNSLPNNSVLDLVVMPDNNLLIGTWAGGVTHYDTKRDVFTNYINDPNDPTSIAANSVFTIEKDVLSNSGYWVGTWGEGLDYFDSDTREFKHIGEYLSEDSESIGGDVRIMEPDEKGNIWLGTANGVYYLTVDRANNEYTAKRYINVPEDANSLSENAISCIYQSTKGQVWIGTENRGLNLYVPADDKFAVFDKESGLPSNAIKSIEADKEGNLWISSAKGLSKVSITGKGLNTQLVVQNYDKGDGLQSNFFNMNASIRTSWNEMYFGGSDGFNRFYASEIQNNPIPPSVVFTDFSIFNKSIKPSNDDNAILKKHISEAKEIQMTYKDEIFTIDFVVLNYTRPEKNSYAYMMEEMDEDWNYVGNQTSATYTTLAPGDYTFKVKAANNDGVWNETPTTILIYIAPPFWATWWFRSLMIVAVVAGIYFYSRYKRLENQRQKAELQAKLDEAVAEVKSRNDGLRAQNDNLSSSINDTNFVIQEAVESGNFSARINTQNKEGQWKALSESINKLFDAVVAPIHSINEIVKDMAEGDLAKRLDEDAKGEILLLTQNFNRALSNINELLHQITESANTIDASSSEMLSTSEEMTRNTEEIASAISQMSNGAQTQVSKVDESSTIVEKIRQAAEDMAAKSQRINQVALEGSKRSEKGLTMVNNVSSSMSEISEYTSKTNHSMNILKERSLEIHRVLGVISNIAGQTNLLALNAAIEAAQAGDAGRGFAVVADEIRKLAESSKASTKEIEKLINDVQTDTSMAASLMETMSQSVSRGVSASGEVSKVFEEISEASNETLSYSEEIMNATQEQTQNINQVVTTIENVVVIAEQTAAGTEEVAASANELVSGMTNYNQKSHRLSEIAKSLRDSVGKFVLTQHTSTSQEAQKETMLIDS
ncbi:two-component regulator propeller domain-containing protein [Reichenbachiella ulvae]|uniref:Methyl-accepting chemotaxis protein n=1 Tax=Reichenbachiella ulvae TaxID=2980104 RepID=A0ABT3CPZ5_9BACT|nr:two-component regulator propeller domain-containing protein [Reichenbachiella ulvae]MCV9385539.1 methyl-accepting chemotaxis protein [Reichenbachiella ulvae]